MKRSQPLSIKKQSEWEFKDKQHQDISKKSRVGRKTHELNNGPFSHEFDQNYYLLPFLPRNMAIFQHLVHKNDQRFGFTLSLPIINFESLHNFEP